MSNKGYVAVGSVSTTDVVSLSDSFGGGTIDTSKWTTFTTSGGSVAEGSGALNISLPSGAGAHAGVYSVDHYDLTGVGVQVEIANPDNSGTSGTGNQIWLGLMTAQSSDALNSSWSVPILWTVLTAGILAFGWSTGGTQTVAEEITWDPVNHKFWQIVESAGDIYWNTSPDGVTWTQRLQSTGHPIAVTSVYALLEAYANTGEAPSFGAFGVPVQAFAEATAVILAPDDSFVSSSGRGLPAVSQAVISYGDTEHDIRDALAAAVRSDAGDSSLDIEFVN